MKAFASLCVKTNYLVSVRDILMNFIRWLHPLAASVVTLVCLIFFRCSIWFNLRDRWKINIDSVSSKTTSTHLKTRKNLRSFLWFFEVSCSALVYCISDTLRTFMFRTWLSEGFVGMQKASEAKGAESLLHAKKHKYYNWWKWQPLTSLNLGSEGN